MPYIGNQPFGKTVRTVTTETIASAKTAYYPNGGYMAGYVDVFVNGVRLSESLDFTATDGSLVTLLYTPNIGDTVEIVTYGSVEIANAVRRSGDTFSGNVYVGSNVYISTSTISVGNATVNTQITAGNIALNGSTLTIGNSTVNTVFTGDTVTVGGTLSLGNTTITGTANVTTAINVGANVSMNATSIRVGNSTVNTYIVSDTIYGPSTLYIDPAAAGDNTGLVVVKGDLQVDGTTFTINSANVTVNDKNVVLASGAINNAATDGAGLTIYGTSANLTYNATGNNFEMSRGLNVTGTANVSVALNVGANVSANTTALRVGNSTVNTSITSTALTTTSNTVSIGTAAYVVANGNVGIGTSTPAARLQVSGGATYLTSGGLGGLFGNDNASYLVFGASTTANAAGIYLNGSTRPSFESHLQYAGAQHTWFNEAVNVTRMVLDTNGNLGVGTTSISASYGRLTVSGTGITITADTSAKLQIGRYSAGAPFSYIKMGSTSSGLKITDPADSYDLMTLTSAGNLGVGISVGATPTQKLDVNGTINANGIQTSGSASLGFAASKWMVQQETADQSLMYYCGANSSTYGTHYLYRATSTGSPLITMTYAASGNIGVGNTAPTEKLHITGTATAGATQGPRINLQYTGTSGAAESLVNFLDFRGVVNAAIGNNLQDDGVGTAAADMVFKTATSGTLTERMRIKQSGNVGIGTNTPVVQLHVGSYATYGGGSGEIELASSSSGWGSVLFGDGGTGSDYYRGYLQYQHNGDYMLIGTATVERMRITNTGNVLIGTTTITDANQALLVLQSSYPKTRMEIRNDGQTASLYAITFYNANGLIGNITPGGSGTAYNTTSDYRLKRDVQPMTGALTKILAVKPVTYKWKADGSDGQGFIAHELAEVCPDAVTGVKDEVNEDGSIKPQGVDSSFLVATLTAAIQEQQALIQTLTARITALES